MGVIVQQPTWPLTYNRRRHHIFSHHKGMGHGNMRCHDLTGAGAYPRSMINPDTLPAIRIFGVPVIYMGLTVDCVAGEPLSSAL